MAGCGVGRKSRFGCVVVVFVHPACRKRLDSRGKSNSSYTLCSLRCPKCTIRAPCRRMDHVKQTFSLEASDSQLCCGSSHTSVISAIVATILSSSSRSREDQVILAWFVVVTHGSGGVECVTAVDDDDDDAPPGFGTDVLSTSIWERFAASSSESRNGTSCSSGLSDMPLASGAADLGCGSL